jgi:hypothetical protein
MTLVFVSCRHGLKYFRAVPCFKSCQKTVPWPALEWHNSSPSSIPKHQNISKEGKRKGKEKRTCACIFLCSINSDLITLCSQKLFIMFIYFRIAVVRNAMEAATVPPVTDTWPQLAPLWPTCPPGSNQNSPLPTTVPPLPLDAIVTLTAGPRSARGPGHV